MHSPDEHVSVWVQPFWSLQPVPSGATLLTLHPVTGSSVLSFWSATHVPVWQPLWRHTDATGVCTQPPCGSQESIVQVKPSLQLPMGWRHPCCGSQMSSVHALLSSQLTASTTQWPAEQRSFVVHALLSWQSAFVVQEGEV
jgi:hypothetical protein